MKTTLQNAIDFRQSTAWKTFMQAIGWKVERIDNNNICIRPMLFGTTYIKIQHPYPLPSLKKIEKIAQKHNALCVVVEPHIAEYDEKKLKQAGYRLSKLRHAPTATRKMDISQPIPTIIESFSENAKRNIKKAQKNNVIIKTVLAKDDKKNEYFEKYYLLQKHLTDMKKFYAPGHTESKKKNTALKNASFFTFAFDPKDKNNPIATVWYGFDASVVTYLQTGINQKGYALLANYLLVLEGIKVGKKLGCHTFDFESIYDERYPKEAVRWKGYSQFKSRFHGEEIYYPPSWIKFYNPYFKWFYVLTQPFI